MLKAGSSPALLANFLPEKDRDILVHCADLVRWDKVWTQLMLSLSAVLPKLPLFVWLPRHWFDLTHPEIERTYTRANEISQILRYTIVGGRGPLDRLDEKQLARKSTGYSYRISSFEDFRTHYYWVIGDYFGVSSISANCATSIDRIYEQTKGSKALSPNVRQHLLSQKCNGKIRCSWDPRKAEKCRKIFLKFFNLELKENGELEKVKRGEL